MYHIFLATNCCHKKEAKKRNDKKGHRMILYKLVRNSGGMLEFEQIPFTISGTEAPKEGKDIGNWEITSSDGTLYKSYEERVISSRSSSSNSPRITRTRSAGGNNKTRRRKSNK